MEDKARKISPAEYRRIRADLMQVIRNAEAADEDTRRIVLGLLGNHLRLVREYAELRKQLAAKGGQR
jgi:hypothetical protein